MPPNGPIPDWLRNDRTPSDPSHPADSLRHSLAALCSERLKAAERGGKLCCFVLRNTAVSGHSPPGRRQNLPPTTRSRVFAKTAWIGAAIVTLLLPAMTRCAHPYVHTHIHIHTRTLFHLYVERGASPVGGFYRREKIWTCTIPPFFISLFINPSLWPSCEFFFSFTSQTLCDVDLMQSLGQHCCVFQQVLEAANFDFFEKL